MNKITLIFPYYRNPNMLAYQLRVWDEYPQEVLDRIEIIVVDDGSRPGTPASDIMTERNRPRCNHQLFEILVDIPWNVGGARNLGVSNANYPWVFYVDIDHIVPAKLLINVLEQKLDPLAVYRFHRKGHFSGRTENPHKEVRLMTKAMYWLIGGHDETYSGWHSLPEFEFENHVHTRAKEIVLDDCLEVVGVDSIADASTTNQPRNRDNPVDIFMLITEWKNTHAIPRRVLHYPWRKVI